MKHTPGPWQQNGSHIYGPDPKRYGIAQLMYADPLESDANARLIAAAPELLEALKRARTWIPSSLPYAKVCDALIERAEPVQDATLTEAETK